MFMRSTKLSATTKLSAEYEAPPIANVLLATGLISSAVLSRLIFAAIFFVRALEKTYLLTSLGYSLGWCGLAMCMALVLAFSFVY